jgi:hypothetical protein
MKPNLRSLLLAAAATLAFLPSLALAQQAPLSESDKSAPSLPAAETGTRQPQGAWDDWLSQNGVQSGLNKLSGGSDFQYYAYSQSAVAEGPPEQFVNRRNIAFQKAMLMVKGELAKFVATDIESGQLLKVVESNGAAPPPLLDAAKPLSVMDKAQKLTEKALDDQIKRYDPTWDGTGLPPEQRRQRLVQLEEAYQNRVATQARLFVSGAMPAAVFEGMGSDGRYTVGVGAVWSPRLAKRAYAILDPSTQSDRTPSTISVRDQIKSKLESNPQFLSAANGLAIWRNELGEPSILAFVGIDASSSQMVIDGKTRTLATQMIQQFVGEQVVAKDNLNQQLSERKLDDGKQEVFDQSGYQSQIEATAPKMSISGLAGAYQWDGVNPVSKGRMVVRVFAWTPSSRAAAGMLGAAGDTQRRAVEKGGAAVSPTSGQPNVGGMQAAPLRNGQSTNASEF